MSNPTDPRPAETPSQKTLTDFLLCYALGNLAVLPFWVLFFGRNGMGIDDGFVHRYYELPQEFSGIDCIAAIVLGLLLSALVYLCLVLIRRNSNASFETSQVFLAVPGLTLLAILGVYLLIRNHAISLDHASIHSVNNFSRLSQLASAVGITVAAVTVSLYFFRHTAFQASRLLIMCTAPFGLVMTVNGVAAHLKAMPADGSFFSVDYTLAPVLPSASARGKVLFVIFDAWDQHLTFEARLPGLELPNIDRLASESFVATNMTAAGISTNIAMPGIFSGRRVKGSKPVAGDDLRIVWKDSGMAGGWRHELGLLGDARRHGHNTSMVVTAIHPYCRMFREAVSDCWTDNTPFGFERSNFLNRIDDVIIGTLRHLPYVGSLIEGDATQYHPEPLINFAFKFRETVIEKVLDPRWSFVFMHQRMPHDPFIYDIKNKKYAVMPESDPLAYWGNLVALDRIIGEMRKRLEQAGLWDEMTIVLSSDHSYKGASKHYREDPKNRVPLLVKLPGQKHRVEFVEPVNAIALRGMLESIFAGRVRAPEQLIDYYQSAPGRG